VGEYGEVLLMDWGLAKRVEDSPDISENDRLSGPVSSDTVEFIPQPGISRARHATYP